MGEVMLLLVLACTNPQPKDSTQDTGLGTVSSVLEVSPSIINTHVSTVKRVQWQGEAGDHLVYTDSMGILQHRPAIIEGDRAEALLRGFPSYATAEFHIERSSGGSILSSNKNEVVLGGLPAMLPQLSIEGAFEGYVTMPIIGEQEHALAVMNGKGEFIWAVTSTDEQALAEDEYLWVMASFGKDGESLLVQSDAHKPEQMGHLYRYNWAGERTETHAIPGGHLSFVEISNGHYYVLGYEHADTLDDNGERIRNDTIVEIQGTEQAVIWTALDAFPYEEFGGANSPDWMHLNYLALDEFDQSLLLSIARLDAYAKLNPSNQELEWVHSTRASHSTLSSSDPEQVSLKPHSIEALENEQYLVFNRDAPSGCSEWVLLNEELENNQLSVINHGASDNNPCLRVIFLGQALPLPGQQLLLNYSDKAQLDVLSASGERSFRAQANLGNAFGFLQHSNEW